MPESRRLIKSRSGCQQCKRRRVKCDESTPSCQQCCRQKLKCPGYQKPLKWVDAQEVPKPTIHCTSREHHLSISKLSSAQDSKPLPLNNPSFTQDLALRQPLVEESSGLIHHYFTRVCKIAGCFDSDLNPFRIVPAAMMSYSKPVFLLLQASSAVHLSRQHPRMRLKALSLQSEAFSAVRDDIGKLHGPTDSIVSDELMLTSIIAGLTSAWYDVNDLGLSHVLGSQVLLRLWLMSQKGRLKYQQTFILGAFVYWLMISAFVAGDPRESFEYQQTLQDTIRNLEMGHDIVDDNNTPRTLQKFIPHPLTGFSTELLIVIGKVGSLCRMHQNGEGQEYLEEKARVIESELFDLIQLHQANFKDPQDPETTIQDILRVGEAYRCAGLLQLYTTFPQLLQQQAQLTPSITAETAATNLSLEMEAMILNATGEFTPAQHNWLRALAFHIFKILETVPATSGTRVLQGLVVLIAATWLVDPVNSFESESESDNNHIQQILNHPKLPLKPSSASKEHWRDIVRCGLRMHGEYVGLKQVSRVLEIVEEVWRLDDSKGKACDWMVVVASKGLQTLYG